jgi:hypothetical protein
MRTKYKLTIKIADFTIYDTVYDFTEEFLTELLQKAAENEDFCYCINDGGLESLIYDHLNEGLEEENREISYSEIVDTEWSEKVIKYPEFTVATIIAQKVFAHNIFGDFGEIHNLFRDEDLVKKHEIIDEMEQYSWECIPIN